MCPHVTATNLVLQGVPTLQLIFGVRWLATALTPGSLLPGIFPPVPGGEQKEGQKDYVSIPVILTNPVAWASCLCPKPYKGEKKCCAVMCPHVTATYLVLQGVPTLQLIFGVRKLACALIPGSLLPGLRPSCPCIRPLVPGGKQPCKGVSS